jgi:hypothetical protein
MTPDEARELVNRGPGPRTGSIDTMVREQIEAPNLLALLSIGTPLPDAQRIAAERAADFTDRLLHGEPEDPT